MSLRLKACDLTVGYGVGRPVVENLDLELRPGQVVALLGPNGAGKTTTMLALAGELPLTSGEVYIDGELTKSPLHVRARNGLSFVTEERSIFSGMSTIDNLRVGRVTFEQALELFPELESRKAVRAGLLSGGEQQMLTLARALGRSPKVLLADELSLGLAPMVVTRLLEAVRQAARETDAAVLVVEQHVRKVMKYADYVHVMNRGQIVLSGAAEEMRGRVDEIEAAYLHGAAAPE